MIANSNLTPFTGAGDATELPLEIDDCFSLQAAVSTALGSVFRGKFCDLILANRKTTTFSKHYVIYDVGDEERTIFFLVNGFVKVGAIMATGHEVIYDVRKGGDIVGELCASEPVRVDRAVALESTDAICVPFQDVVGLLPQRPDLIAVLVAVFCQRLKEAYAQVNTLAIDDTVRRLIKVLLNLAARLGQRSGSLIMLPIYLTQEEIAQMVAARRERISTALNSLRRQGMLRYSTRGHLMLDVSALEAQLSQGTG
jgi:CRP-like cAMP-binding protein